MPIVLDQDSGKHIRVEDGGPGSGRKGHVTSAREALRGSGYKAGLKKEQAGRRQAVATKAYAGARASGMSHGHAHEVSHGVVVKMGASHAEARGHVNKAAKAYGYKGVGTGT